MRSALASGPISSALVCEVVLEEACGGGASAVLGGEGLGVCLADKDAGADALAGEPAGLVACLTEPLGLAVLGGQSLVV